jgi:hypothetical protein
MILTIKSYLYRKKEEQFSFLKLGVGILILLVCGLRLIRNFNNIVDISFDDEVKYLRYGLDLFDSIKNDWGPTYNIWYKFLSFFEQRPIELYLLNYKVVILLTAISFYLFLYTYGFSFAVSLWVSFCLLISNTNIVTYPRISHVIVSFFLICMVINKLFIKSKAKQYILICFALFTGAFARPELMLSFLIFSVFTGYTIWKKHPIKEWIFFSLPFFGVLVFLLLVFNLPANTYMGKDRLYGVFCQHYTVKYIYTHKADYALFIDWIAFSKEQFPGCETFTDIVKKYPIVVIQGMLTNIKIFVLVILGGIADILYPKYLYYKKALELLSFIVVFVLLSLGLFSKDRRAAIWNELKEKKELFFILLVFALPGFASSVVFFPRPHYLLFLMIPIIVYLSVFLDIVFSGKKIKEYIILILALIFMIKTPDIKTYKTPHIISGTCPNQSYKQFIRTLNQASDKPHVIFSNILNLSMMTDKNFTDFGAEDKYTNDKPFTTHVQEQQIDHILVTEFLLQDRRLKKDTTWLQLIATPEAFGFRKKMLFKDCPTYLLYKE